MIQELLYTSHEGRGLRQGGGGGYCTVLSTEGMASNLAAALEKLSGYKHPFDIHDPRSRQNPVNWRHAIIRVGGVAYHVLSRIADLKGEHTGRSNKLAHHVVLTPADQVPGGPTRLLTHPAFSRSDWDGKVELVHAVPRSSLPNDDLPNQVCRHWQATGGDAGLAGHVADLLQKVPNPTVSVIFPLGADALALVDEVFSLLTPQQRWNTTFSTYYAAAPPVSSCHLRFILDGTSDAELLRRDHRQMVIDLANPPSPLAETPLIAAARSGVHLKARPDAPRARHTSGQPNSENLQAANEARTANQLAALEPLPSLADETLSPPIHVDGRAGGRIPSSSPKQYRAYRRSTTAQQQQSKEKWVLKACLLISTSLCAGAAVTFFLLRGADETPTTVAQTDSKGETTKNEKPPAPTLTPRHLVADPSSISPDATSAYEPPAEGERSLEGTASEIEGVVTETSPSESGEQISLEGPTPAVPAIEEPHSATQATTLKETTLTLLEGPQIPLLSDLGTPPSQEEIGKAEAIVGGIEECHLLGLEWIGFKWGKLSEKREAETLELTKEGLEWKVKIPGIGALGSPISLCSFKVRDDGKTVFSWNSTQTGQKIKRQPKKTAVLNGLRWCVMRVTATDGTPYYFGLSDQQQHQSKVCNLFQSEPQSLLPTSLPSFDVNANPPRVALTIESHSLSITQPLDPNGAITFKYPLEDENDYILFKIAIRAAEDETSELICSHEIYYQALVNAGDGLKPITEKSSDISSVTNTVKKMEGLKILRDNNIQKLDDEIESKDAEATPEEQAEKRKRLNDLKSSKQSFDDLINSRIVALNQFVESTYNNLKNAQASVSPKIIYKDPDSKQEITVPVFLNDAIGPSP